MTTYDLVVLGTGPAASRVADACASGDWKVAIVEVREFGGTCALRGCNPKKVFVRAAELVDWARRASGKLARTAHSHIDWPELVNFKREFTDAVPTKSETSYREKGIVPFHGQARFVAPRQIEVDGQVLCGKHILIAVGAKPAPLEFCGHEFVITSDAFMELDHLPKNVLFIGGGYISFEFAHVAARAGARVVILDHGARPLKQFDPDLVRQLAIHSQEMGIDLVTNAEIIKVEGSQAAGFVVHANVAGTISNFSADLVVHGAGRVPNLDGLRLDAGSVQFNSDGVVVNQHLQSVSNPSVFAAGDCAASGQAKLTPTANQQGRTIARNLLAGEMRHTPDYGVVPSAVFTVPSLAAVGLSEADARKAHRQFETLTGDMASWGSVRKVCQSCAGYKILVERNTELILGAHLLGPNAAETINLFALAMKFNLSASDIKSVLYTFPSFVADIRSML